MIENLAARGVKLGTIAAYPTTASQSARLRDTGFSSAQRGMDMTEVWDTWTAAYPTEADRIASLEIFDEFEEWNLLARHYCLAFAHHSSDASIFPWPYDGIK